jgi:hypothetical protein
MRTYPVAIWFFVAWRQGGLLIDEGWSMDLDGHVRYPTAVCLGVVPLAY